MYNTYLCPNNGNCYPFTSLSILPEMPMGTLDRGTVTPIIAETQEKDWPEAATE